MILLVFDGLVDEFDKEVNSKDALKLPIFVVQKAAATKNEVKFCKRSFGVIKSSLATSYNVWRRRASSLNFDQSEA